MTETVYAGSLDRYKAYKEYLIQSGAKFKSRETLSSALIIFPNGKKKSFSSMDGNLRPYLYLCGWVKRDAKKWLKRKKIPKVLRKVDINYINPNIHMHINHPMILTDVRKCYTTIAYKLGIISKRTFEKLSAIPPEMKLVRQIAFGSLATTYISNHYNEGKPSDVQLESDHALKYAHRQVLLMADEMMNDLKSMLGNDLYMWQTDCAYYNPDRADEVHEYFDSREFEYKDEMAQIMEYDFDNHIVYWRNSSDISKIKYAHLDIRTNKSDTK